MSELRQKMKKAMELRDFAPRTQESYLWSVEGLAKFFKRSPDKINQEEVEDYLLYLKNDRQLAYSTRNQIASGLKFFYNEVLKRSDMKLVLPPKVGQRKLPEILTMKEVSILLEAPDNFKHRVLLKTTCSAGLRVSEVVSLKPKHIDSSRMLIRVCQAKGRKDRYTILYRKLLVELRDYYKLFRPKNWRFPAKNPKYYINVTTAQRIYNKAKRKAKIKKGTGIHTLRHCFATHLLEMGYDIQKIKMLLGHRSLSTTMFYLHVSRKHLTSLRSPLDFIEPEIETRIDKETINDGDE
jgi:site-specific recombinase XerD